MEKKVGIVLVNYKDYATRFLEPCRDSLRAQDYSGERHFYVVDNAATTESQAYLKKTFPEATILSRPDGNYAAANNVGFNQAIKDGCEYLITVNMDTEASWGWLSGLVTALDENPSAVMAQSKVLLFPRSAEQRNHPLINSLGNAIHYLGFGFTVGYGEADREIEGYPEIEGYASGCSFIIRAETFEKIGGYDEEFYMYHDDLELSLKAKLTGGKLILAPRSVIFHKYEFSRSVGMLYYMERNRVLTALLFYPRWLLVLTFPAFVLMAGGMLFYSILGGWLPTYLRIAAYYLRPNTYRKIAVLRRRLKNLSPSVAKVFFVLARHFSGRIEFQEIANPILKYVANPLFNLYWRVVKSLI